MYIDTDFNTLLPSLPNAYKYTSNFDYLSNEELKLFNVFKVESFVQNEAYQDLQAILGTEFYTAIPISIIANKQTPSIDVEVVIDRRIAINKIKELTGHSGDYATVQDAILDKEIYVAPEPVVVEPDVVVYDYQNSYVFVVLGTSELSVLNESPNIEANDISRFKYILNNDDPDQMPQIELGNTLIQTSGFSGTVTYIDAEKKVIKLENCISIESLNRSLPLLLNNNSIGNIFCYELYLKVVSINGEEWIAPIDWPIELSNQKITNKILHTNSLLEYKENYKWNVIGDESATVKVEMASCDLSMTNVRSMTEYGRYA